MHEFESKALDPVTRDFYRAFLQRLTDEKVPFLVGGAYAFAAYTGIVRHTKDLDLFVTPSTYPRVLEIAEKAGLRTEVTNPLWIAKIFSGDAFIDIIFRSGNSITEVTDEWFSFAGDARLLGVPIRLCAPEETLWSKAFIMERERYDGADVAHYLLAWGHRMDWPRLLRHFGPHWRVLLSHLVLFGFIYPEHRSRIPASIMDELTLRLREETHQPDVLSRACPGTYLNRAFYLVDVKAWGYEDPRFQPHGTVTRPLIDHWRRQVEEEEAEHLKLTGISLEETSPRPVSH